ncbi:aromatic prenyltransferase [Annulohypoxylon truncatum]|uniref:aromatic prenyltransferase n=1 Tax=Annulohypoxylon truncatum TaxID=327061 RepID=UPI0020072F15|nr:aromatic prenyltransferase [Annulohypoxylon truncatum]KAI1205180.1 aromatic prenyltransferase [Annulohypoxylon truncatum]
MATEIATLSSLPLEAVDEKLTMAATPAAEFWSKHARSTLGPMLSSTGTYTASDQASHLQFFDEHVASCLGSQPEEPKAEYYAHPDLAGTRFEVSLNLTTRGKAKVRYSFDLIRDGTGPDPFGEDNAGEMLRRLCSVTGGDGRLMERLMGAFFLSPSETVALSKKVQPHLQIPPAAIAFELEGSQQILKAYIPIIKKSALGKPPVDITLNALRGLETLGYDMSYNVDLLEEYLNSRPGKVNPVMVGIDCLDPTKNQGSRVKVYVVTESSTFATARDVITLGGRLNDESTLKGVKLLRSVWHLLLNEPKGIPDDEIDTWSKQQRAPGVFFSGLLFSIDLAAGKRMPHIKIYVPVFQYSEHPETPIRNTNAALKMLGHEWGQTGKFSEVINAVFGQQKAHRQSYVTYSYTESKGVYLTSYLGMPLFNREEISDKYKAGLEAYNILD